MRTRVTLTTSGRAVFPLRRAGASHSPTATSGELRPRAHGGIVSNLGNANRFAKNDYGTFQAPFLKPVVAKGCK
jgi:hypothetical protein